MRPWAVRHPILLILAVFIIVPIVVGQITSSSGPEPTPEQQIVTVKEQSARILARSYVEQVPLKSPSTAKYHTPTAVADPKDPNLYEVSSYIDSQNGFGAMIRTYWSMKLEFMGEDTQESVQTDSNWKVKEFIFDGEKVK